MRAALPVLFAVALASGCGSSPAPPVAQAAPRTSPPPPRAAVALVRPSPPAGCRGVQACVDTATSTAWLMHGSSVVAGPLVVSLGGPGHPTPRGTFAVAWKDQVHTSSTYGIPMPWSVFFAPGGIAFHEGDVRSASHGCVHLRHADAVLVFSRLARGDAVRVL